MDSLQERLEDAAQTPANPPYRLATLIQVVVVILHRSVMPFNAILCTMQSTCEHGSSHGYMCT